MGPRPFGRGDEEAYIIELGGKVQLQWGRDLSVAEIADYLDALITVARLQWGRDLSVAEILQLTPPSRAGGACFNGAATFRSRRSSRGRSSCG